MFKELFTLERVIDCYLIKFDKIDIGQSAENIYSLVYSGLENSMLYKKRRAVPPAFGIYELVDCSN